MAKNKYNLTIADIKRALNNITKGHGITIGPPEIIEIAGALTTGEVLYKANLGTKEHPFWIYGTKESLQKRIEDFQRQMLDILKGNNNGNNTSPIHNE